MSDDIVFESAHDTGHSALALPSATPGIVDARAGADAAASAPSAGAATGALDDHGTPHDPAVHETDPATGLGRLSRDGAWKKKRGNGSRAAAGKPLAGATQGKLVIPSSQVQPGDEMPPTVTVSAAPGAPAPAIPSGASVTGVAATPPMVETKTMEEYETTAVGMSQGLWAVFRSAGGPAWDPDKDEERAWARAIQRVWFHYQLPIIGPVIELLILTVRAFAKRSGEDGSRLRRWVAGAWRWVRGGSFSEPEVKTTKAGAV